MIGAAVIAIIALSSAFLFVYGVNLLYLSWRALLLAPAIPPAADPPPGSVLVQLPIFDERYVAERGIDAVARAAWPAGGGRGWPSRTSAGAAGRATRPARWLTASS